MAAAPARTGHRHSEQPPGGTPKSFCCRAREAPPAATSPVPSTHPGSAAFGKGLKLEMLCPGAELPPTPPLLSQLQPWWM